MIRPKRIYQNTSLIVEPKKKARNNPGFQGFLEWKLTLEISYYFITSIGIQSAPNARSTRPAGFVFSWIIKGLA